MSSLYYVTLASSMVYSGMSDMVVVGIMTFIGKHQFGEAGFDEVGFGEAGFGETGFGETGFGEAGFGEVGFCEAGFDEAGGYPFMIQQRYYQHQW